MHRTTKTTTSQLSRTFGIVRSDIEHILKPDTGQGTKNRRDLGDGYKAAVAAL